MQVRVTPDQIVESVDASLKRLGTDYIDLLQVWTVRPVWGGGRGGGGGCGRRMLETGIERWFLMVCGNNTSGVEAFSCTWLPGHIEIFADDEGRGCGHIGSV